MIQPEIDKAPPLAPARSIARIMIRGDSTPGVALADARGFDAPSSCLSMEKNIEGARGRISPVFFLRRFGKGRVVYFPWDIARVYWEVMTDDHGKLLRNAIEWALDEERPVTVSVPGVLDVTVWKQKQSMTVHLVNLTNPMMMRPSFRETIPSPPQDMRISLPQDRRVSKVQLLVAGTIPSARIANGVMTLNVSSISDDEVIAIDFA